jgi:LPS export ABC transporter protein LptC
MKKILAGILILVFIGGGCTSPSSLPTVANNIPIPQQTLEDFRLIVSEGGIRAWELESRTAQIYEKLEKVYIQDFRASLYEEGELVSVLSAQRGILDVAADNIEATGTVIVTSAKGSRLETEELHYISSNGEEEKKGKFVTEEFLKITEPDRVTTGYGLKIDTDLENAKIKRDVKVKVESLSVP